jgi:hypothetical protein
MSYSKNEPALNITSPVSQITAIPDEAPVYLILADACLSAGLRLAAGDMIQRGLKSFPDDNRLLGLSKEVLHPYLTGTAQSIKRYSWLVQVLERFYMEA